MQMHLLAVGARQPRWVDEAYQEYAKRLPRQCRLTLREIPIVRRGASTPPQVAVSREGERLLEAIPRGARTIALDERGKMLDTRGLAVLLEQWLVDGGDTALLVGGPDGLAQPCLDRAELAWSLSRLTLPHGLARVLVAEQLYRAWTVTSGHPYHRT
jgi:23S rRNA (pseudouridine1915-N3)-methyltransferase